MASLASSLNPVAYFFCRHDEAAKSDPRNLVRTIAHQLLSKLPWYERSHHKIDWLGLHVIPCGVLLFFIFRYKSALELLQKEDRDPKIDSKSVLEQFQILLMVLFS